MAVNSGSLGTQISFSDLQNAYGGSHPISLSEYYRGGSEVPSTSTTTLLAAGSGSGSGDGSAASISVDVQNADSSSIGGLTNLTNQPGNGIVNLADLSYIHLRAQGMGNHSVVRYPNANGGGHPTSIFQYSQDDNPGFTVSYRGSAYQSGDQVIGGTPGFPSGANSNGSIGYSGFSTTGDYTYIGRRTITNVSRRTFVFTNNTGQTITLTTTAMGGNSNTTTLTNGSSVTRGPFNGSNQSWTVSYPAVTTTVNANTNIPTSGESNLDQFNVPGAFAG